ncbi:unnamed protein product [Mytilus edulis]|uniref:Uncharacterized protein n=1 Tax=Mytilus edulis TaxID=6550 RepID=A0A8S3TWH4_MYTED|nr:unnamed protein product [Mytilus edulis]
MNATEDLDFCRNETKIDWLNLPRRSVFTLRFFHQNSDYTFSYIVITGIEVLDDGRVLICDNHNNKVKLFRYDGTFLSSFFVEGFPLDLRMIGPHSFVVTNDLGNKLVVLIIVGDVIMHGRDILIKPNAVGVCFMDGYIYLTYPWGNPPEVVKIDTDGKVIQTIKRNAKRKPIFSERPVSICAFSGLIYVSCMSIDGKKDKIYKFSKEGNILAIHEHPQLQEARYLSKDMFGNIYVCGMINSNIIRFDRSGQKSRIVMSQSDGLRDPCSIGILDQTLFIAQDGLDIIKVLTMECFSETDDVGKLDRKRVSFS